MTSKAELTESTWTRFDADYEAFAEPLSRQIALLAIPMVGGIGPGTRVLDIAAGTGALSLPAAETGAEVLAIDSSPSMIARLSRRLAAYPGCLARVMDGQALDLPDGAFDAAFSVFGVMLFPDWAQGLRELARSVRIGGHGCLAVWSAHWGAPQMVLLADAFGAILPDQELPQLPEGMLRLSVPSVLKAEMETAVFVEVTVRIVDAAWSGPSVDHLVVEARRMASFVPFFAELDRNHGDQLDLSLREALKPYVSGSSVSVPFSALVAVCRRTEFAH